MPHGKPHILEGFQVYCSQDQNKNPKFSPQNESKTQNFVPAASKLSGTGSTNMYIAKLGQNQGIW